MTLTWIGSPNYWAGRTMKVTNIVLHWMAGTLAGTDVTFQKAGGVSAHYGIECEIGHQYVRPEDTAWHAMQANPFTIGIEHSAQPGRDANEATYRSSIELCANLCRHLDLNPDTSITLQPHNYYNATTCPGTLDIARIRRDVRTSLSSVTSPVVIAPDKPALPQPIANQSTGGFLRLPSSATSWRVYREGGPWTTGNEIGRLNPSLFGGLTYDILGNPTANVYIIQTKDFGRVAIYAGSETGAQVSATNQGITMGVSSGKSLYLPVSAPTWRVYKEGGPYRPGYEVGYLAPARFGGLIYSVLAQPMTNVAVIQTQNFGRVAIYAGPETGAVIK